ncbi:hypothetical protein RclHR1_06070005 [Rhizophagus clarus]|uniref:Protein kinase domain-containing protein n=1 Tax=Rhizophagus clarus TaxID=94130 RepID=A0A2Z6SHT0_9GLOM|nr:hypothetical protein RclHR1_06070005 [Rhizophagus clarus]
MVVMDYANKGNLKGNLARIVKYNWKQKLFMLYKVISGLNEIHNQGFIHCNLHDGNILNHRYNNDKEDRIYINYSKLSRPENYIFKANDKDTFGVLPFMAPEVIKGKRYTKASDIYSFSMIMWEFTSGTPPFNDSKDARLLQISICNGDRPKIIENTPKCYKDLMEKCWNNDQSRRPTALEVKNVIQKWIFCPNDGKINEELKSDIMEFIKAPIGNNLDVKSINSCTSYNFEKPNEIHEIQSLDEKSNGTREDVKSLDSYVLDGEIDWNS